ncbi:NAD(P)H-binding protein [Nocardia aurantia]|uniref:NAD(P)H azoreductase n=1 Tax=Nocardia aurantia TaxID=2585199 RepID=A0A7K0E173_9NOCA|nr:NAD(P)H-binding protein [Nocardia aurantia]MQY31621.1 NAD(P)H azoreductase [Nocardia aurantia]
MPPILVTGAAGGQQGATGRRVTETLLAAAHQVHAFVRTDDTRAAQLKDLGAEVIVGDLREITTVRPAVRDIHRAYFTYPVTAGMLDATAVFAAAAHDEGLERVVAVSQLGSDPQAGTPHMRRHWVAEQVLDRADIGAVHLRAAVFFENLRVVIEHTGALTLPLGSPDTVLPLIAAADVADVATAALLAPAPLDPVHWLAGEITTAAEAADAFGVRYVNVDPDRWQETATALYHDDIVVEHLTNLWKLFRDIGSGHNLYQVTASIEHFTGHPPTTLREYLAAEQR